MFLSKLLHPWTIPNRNAGCLHEGPFEVRVSLLAPSTPAGYRTRLRDSRHDTSIGTELLCTAETLDLACRPVRYLASAPDQNRRQDGRDENPDPAAPADGMSLPADPAARARPPAAFRHLNDGASCPEPVCLFNRKLRLD